MICAQELKDKYLEFFAREGHTVIPGASLVPENDPSVLFTTAGMHPLVPYILGQPHPGGARVANCQPCIRTGDIDAVGDESHLSFFEMLGNWSLGDYFKAEAIGFSYRFLTGAEWLGIPRERLAISVFGGDDEVAADEEAARLWREAGIPGNRIHRLGRKDNWWGPAGKTGPCGPDTEMFFDIDGKSAARGAPGEDGSGWLEIWNDVFMEYRKGADGKLSGLERKCVDTGMGVERTVTALQGKGSVYDTELFSPIFAELEREFQVTYTGGAAGRAQDVRERDKSLRIIADHAKAAAMIIADSHDIVPSNVGQGYVVRRLIRRAVRHGQRLGIQGRAGDGGGFLGVPVRGVLEIYRDSYPELTRERGEYIAEVLRREEELFGKTLVRGQQMFERECAKLESANDGGGGGALQLPGAVAFRLYDTYGFPFDLTRELAGERGMTVDHQEFTAAFDKHRQVSHAGGGGGAGGAGAAGFAGGLADHSQQTTALHTATHLLHQALREVLGEHVQQKGSNITAERLRFDFSHPGGKVGAEELARVEEIVNEQIAADTPVVQKTMQLSEAREQGALAFFTAKYSEEVSTYRIGDFSFEVCGGPHVPRTGELGKFRIQKEQASSQGVRRIKATLTAAEKE